MEKDKFAQGNQYYALRVKQILFNVSGSSNKKPRLIGVFYYLNFSIGRIWVNAWNLKWALSPFFVSGVV